MRPHLVRYWLTPSDDPHFEAKVDDVNARSRDAPALAERGERVVSTDELTGVQALERTAPDLPIAPSRPRYREFEYVRHGTRSFFLNRDVATGAVFAPSCGPTRKEEDFVAHLAQTIASDPIITRWHFVVDTLDLHCSESLVRFVAERSKTEADLGRKGKAGILARCSTRAAFLSDPTHTIVFHDTPTHASWLNQIALWLSLLTRKLLKHGTFTSADDLQTQVLRFIAYSNGTMAKPFAWTDDRAGPPKKRAA